MNEAMEVPEIISPSRPHCLNRSPRSCGTNGCGGSIPDFTDFIPACTPSIQPAATQCRTVPKLCSATSRLTPAMSLHTSTER